MKQSIYHIFKMISSPMVIYTLFQDAQTLAHLKFLK